MISTDFAPNEDWADAWVSFKLILQPWRWRNGKELDSVKKRILSQFKISNLKFKISLFLTGRSALYHLLKSLKLPSGSEIIVQAFTCEAVILPILANRLKPVYVDIETETFSMNPIDLEKKITHSAKVVILQHSFGMVPGHRERIVSLIKKHNLLLIEDIAHGAQFPISIRQLADQFPNSYFLLSFGRSKAISSVYGGAIISSNNIKTHPSQPSFWFIFKALLYKPLAIIIKSTYDFYLGKLIHFIIKKLNILSPEITGKEKRGVYDKFLDKAYPNALAMLLLHQLDKYEQIQKNRALICDIYEKRISNLKSQNSKLSLLRFPLLVNKRSGVIKRAAKQNIFLGKWYDQVVAPKDLNLGKVGYKPGICPVAEKTCKEIINLPTNVSIIEAKKILKFILSERDESKD